MELDLISEKNFNSALELFNGEFYFLTTYPDLVAEEELKMFLMKTGQTYLIKEKDSILGLGYFKVYSPGYIFIKFKMKNFNDYKSCQIGFEKFGQIIMNKEKKLKRIESFCYEFEHDEIEFLKKLGFVCEIEKKLVALKDGEVGSMFTYSAVGQELEDMFKL